MASERNSAMSVVDDLRIPAAESHTIQYELKTRKREIEELQSKLTDAHLAL